MTLDSRESFIRPKRGGRLWLLAALLVATLALAACGRHRRVATGGCAAPEVPEKTVDSGGASVWDALKVVRPQGSARAVAMDDRMGSVALPKAFPPAEDDGPASATAPAASQPPAPAPADGYDAGDPDSGSGGTFVPEAPASEAPGGGR